MLKALAKQTHKQNCVCELAQVKTKNNANDTKQFEKNTHTQTIQQKHRRNKTKQDLTNQKQTK